MLADTINGRLYEGRDIDVGTRFADAEFLLARLLLDNSSHGIPSQIYAKAQLQNLAWENGRHKNPVEDWVNAERKYLRDGLEYLAKLQPK